MTTLSKAVPTSTSRYEIERLFGLQRSHQWEVRKSDSSQRKDRLLRLKAALIEHADEAITALASDLGRPGDINEVWAVVAKIDITISKLDDWMAPQPVTELHHASSAFVRWEPRGVVLLFGPWNFPIALLFEPLIAIIAAGNTAIVKPNELAPAASNLSARIIRGVFEENEVAVVEGGVEVAEALLDQPFNHIFLTGSPKVGRAVMAAAAKNLATVTLELGGKCPAIIDPTADIDSVVQQIGETKMINDGQVCLTVDYVLVHRSIHDQVVEKLAGFFTSNYYRGGRYEAEKSARLINKANFRRVRGYLEDAIAKGAEVAFGGNSNEETLVIEPTILTHVPVGADILNEEIFGPVLPIVAYDDVDDVIDHVRAGTSPLAMYVFSEDEECVERILSSTSSGAVSVNGCSTHYWEDALPFGGVGESGMGRYHGVHGFRELSHARAVARSASNIGPQSDR